MTHFETFLMIAQLTLFTLFIGNVASLILLLTIKEK